MMKAFSRACRACFKKDETYEGGWRLGGLTTDWRLGILADDKQAVPRGEPGELRRYSMYRPSRGSTGVEATLRPVDKPKSRGAGLMPTTTAALARHRFGNVPTVCHRSLAWLAAG